MAKTRALAMTLLGVGLLVGGAGCFGAINNPLIIGSAPVPVPVPPWVGERLETKYTDRFKPRTPIMPPILPGMPLPTCEDPPGDEEVIRALPQVTRGIPFIYEEFRDDFTVVVEKLTDTIDPCVYVPLLGPAQLHHCHFKCTVYFKERKKSDYPFPFTAVNDRVEVIYVDKDHYHMCVSGDERTQRSVFKDLAGQ
jgi:hypothetical protein